MDGSENMKQKKIYICSSCGFETKEKNKTCPICGKEMKYEEKDFTECNPTLPKSFSNSEEKDVKLSYYCPTCRKESHQSICICCNTVCYLSIEYHKKKAIVPKIDHLSDVYNEDELKDMGYFLTQEEKNWIYHYYRGAHKFFYKRDKVKFGVFLFTALLMYFTCLEIFFYMQEKEYLFVGYFVNGLGNGLFLLFLILGIWYLFDASIVEFKKIPTQVALFVMVPMVMQIFLCIFLNVTSRFMFISGYIFMLLTAFIYFIYVCWWKKHEK